MRDAGGGRAGDRQAQDGRSRRARGAVLGCSPAARGAGAALQRPVVLWLDDLQWAEPMLLDLLDHVADLSRDAPILLICTARPELLDSQARMGRGRAERDRGAARATTGSDCEALLDQLGDGLEPAERACVIAASQGTRCSWRR